MRSPLINHAHYAEDYRDLLRACEIARPGQIVWLIGPSGSGKSVLLISALNALCGDPRMWSTGCVPAVRVRATLSDRNKFNPKDLVLRLCVGLDDPSPSWLALKDRTSDPDSSLRKIEELALSERWANSRASYTEHALRLGFERSARVRRVQWIAIEEAASILKVHRHQYSDNYMTGLMQLAEEIGCVLIMVGTPDSYGLLEANREVRNRSIVVWSRPYRFHLPEERKGLATMLKALGKRFPLTPHDLLIKSIKLIFLNGGGVFGTTLNYLDRANTIRARAGDEGLELSHLEAASSTLEDQANLLMERTLFEALCYPELNLDIAKILKKAGSRGR